MTHVEAVTLVVVALVGLAGTWLTVRERRRPTGEGGDVTPVTEKQAREGEDPGVMALRIALSTREDLDKAQDDLEAANARLDVLEEQNRRLREVLRGVVVRLERIAEWVRAGHHPPPPYTPEQVMAYISEHVPDLLEVDDA